MAIDSRPKRQSVVSINRLSVSVRPTLLKNQQWRQAVGYSYSGILAAGGPADEDQPGTSLGYLSGIIGRKRAFSRSFN